MNINKRFFSTVVASSLLAIGAIYADNSGCNPCPQDCPPVCKPCPAPCEPCPPPCEPCAPVCSPCYDPCYDPCYNACYEACEADTCCWTGFQIGADFIYWKPCIDNGEFACLFAEPLDTNGHGSGVHNGKYKHGGGKGNWEPGYRIFVGIDDLWCDWGLKGSYTWIKSSNSDRIEPGSSEYLETNLTHTWFIIGPTQPDSELYPDLTISQQFVTLKEDFTYQDYDVLFFTDYCLKRCHNFKPYFGVTGLFLNQHKKSSWQQFQPASEQSPQAIYFNGLTDWESSFSGVGFRFGSEYSFAICNGLKLFGNGSIAVTYGNHDTTSNFQKTIEASSEVLTSYDYDFKDEECIFVPGFHIQIGFEYDACLCGFDFGLRLGYEFLEWSNLPNPRKFTSEGPPEISLASSPTLSTLGFHGLFAGLEFSF